MTKKIRTMQTDPARVRRTDPGNPDVCPVFDLHRIYSDEKTREWAAIGCRTAGIGCLDCKQPVIEAIIRLAEQAAKEPWELATGDAKTAAKAITAAPNRRPIRLKNLCRSSSLGALSVDTRT